MTSQNVSDADNAYYERNQLVAALSKLFPAGLKETTIDGWDDDWHNCVYIDLPTGQVSWHFHKRELPLFHHLKPYIGEWDGHDTPEKYQRLNSLSAAPQLSEAEMVEKVANAIAYDLYGGLDKLYDDKGDWVADRGAKQHDINTPFTSDIRDAAKAALRALNLIGGEDEVPTH